MSQLVTIPMAAHVALTAFLYALLTLARAPAVWGIGRSSRWGKACAALEPRISANLSNQFELPLFFYSACLIFLQLQPGLEVVAFAWIFVAGRLLHSSVQIFTTNIRLRGIAFTVNFVAVLGLWVSVVATAF